ncbi:MAG TPA: M23 family metallopeptidase [Caulobacteraceae bacterium]|nr:M23 family metallopeptidase [Caulobacteraceae bacterium]
MERTEPERLTRRLVLAAGGASLAAPALAADPVRLEGRPVQGGYLVGRTVPGARILLDAQPVGFAGDTGAFLLGFDRDASARAVLQVDGRGVAFEKVLAVAPGTFGVQRVDGVPQSTVTPTDPALLARIRRERALKDAAFASVAPGEDFAGGFAWPLERYRISSRFGNQRILNGTPDRPHYGVDLAAPAGSAITAPAAGLVVLAEPAMHFEGGLTLVDHGQGLISCYLHQSRLLVAKGERVLRGQTIGRVGMTGRATGPHLCWRLRWRGRNLDPSLLTGPRTAA